MKKTSHRLVPLALAASLALSACAGEKQASFDTTPASTPAAAPSSAAAAQPATDGSTATAAAPSTSAAAATDAAATSGDVSTDSAVAAGVDLTGVKPLASATVPAVVEGDPGATMKVSLLSLQRKGKVLMATYSFLVTSDAQNAEPTWLYGYLGDKGWYPYLIDTTNLNRHDVLAGDGRRAQTDSQGPYFAPGQTFYAYAMFAAPAEDVTEMTVSLTDSAPAVMGVPIQ